MNPWEKLGISKRTYYYWKQSNKLPVVQLDTPTVQSGVQLHKSATKECNETFNGANGNRVRNITRKEMEPYVDNFKPNWYRLGLKSRNDILNLV